MNKLIYRFALVTVLVALGLVTLKVKAQSQPAWSKDKAEKWFAAMEWFNSSHDSVVKRKYDAFGRELQEESSDTASQIIVNVNLKPDPSVNKVAFAKSYAANPKRWDKAFAFLRNTDFSKLEPGKYAIDGEDIYATITFGLPKLSDTVKWEAHRNYDDIHYVISGREQIGIVPLSEAKLIGEYNNVRDLAHYSAKGKYHVATPGVFFIITTEEAHKPGIQVDGSDGPVKKLFIKIRKTQG